MEKDLEKIRHSSSHILAQAVKELYPQAKLGIGPAIEEGFYYDFDNLHITPEDLVKIEARMKSIIKENHSFKKFKKTRKESQQILKSEPYKLELLKDLKDDEITFYQHSNFIDLCEGPHVISTSEIKAVKLLSIAGSYWRGSSKNKQLTRIYGTAFFSEKDLQSYLELRKRAEESSHIKLGKQLDLFSFHPEAPGFAFWHPKGLIIWQELESLWKEEHRKAGYQIIKTPILLSQTLWQESGHWDHYKENMYFTRIDNRDFAVKPMNCPGSILIYRSNLHSYREFPLRFAELGLVHRHELSGVLNGLFRTRSFTQDDAHIFCLPDQIEQEIINIINLVDKLYRIFNLEYHVELSTKPEKAMGSPELWKKAESSLELALKKAKIAFKINPGEGAFYGPKIDFHIKDSLNRTWQCATIQLDFQMPLSFKLTYESQKGTKETPVIIHRVVFGAFERFIAILIEHFSGKFPLWLSPVQIKVMNLTERNESYANLIASELKENNFRVELDTKPLTISKKIRDSQEQKIPIMIVLGDKEEKNKTLAVRTIDGKVKYGIKLSSLIKKLQYTINRKSLIISI